MNYTHTQAQDALCLVCGATGHLYLPPFELIPDIAVCAECIERIYYKAGCHQLCARNGENSCFDCPVFDGRIFCQRRPFHLHFIGYDPAAVFASPWTPKPKQLAMMGVVA